MSSDSDFDEVASALYAVPPPEFVKARDERARQAKADGDPDLAKKLKALRRPTQSAWWVDKIVREQPELLEQVRRLGAEYRAAGLTATRLRELAAERQRLLAEITDTVDADVGAETLREIESTFTAVLADPDAERAVRTARLDKPLSYAGFGTTPLSLAPEPPPEAENEEAEAPEPRTREPAKRKPERDKGGRESRATEDRAPEDKSAKERAAEKKAASALREFEEADRSWRDAVAERDELRKGLDELKARLRDAENRLAAAERGVRLAKKRRDRARANV